MLLLTAQAAALLLTVDFSRLRNEKLEDKPVLPFPLLAWAELVAEFWRDGHTCYSATV